MRIQKLLFHERGHDIIRGIPFGPLARNRIDTYRPHGPVKGSVLYLYGGSFSEGDRNLYRFMGTAFARAGYLFAVPDYRVYPEARFPAFVEDAAAAFAWLHQHAPAFGASGPISLMGHSAGAHIASLLLLDRTWLSAHGLDASAIRTFIGLAGPYPFQPLEIAFTRPAFEGTPDIEKARPVNFIAAAARAGIPPVHLFHGARDRTVIIRASEHFADLLSSHGAHVTLTRYEGLSHISLISSMAWPLRWRGGVFSDITERLDRLHGHSGKPEGLRPAMARIPLIGRAIAGRAAGGGGRLPQAA